MPAGAKEVQVVLTFKDDGSYDLKKIVKEINTTLNQAGVSAKMAGQGFEKMNEKVRQTDAGFEKLKGSFKSGMLQMAAGLGIWTGMSQAIGFVTRSIKDSIEQGKRFEEAFTKVRVATKGSASENEALRQSLMRMNPALGSATEMTEALAIAVREFSEYSRADQLKFVETAGKTAVASFTNVETAIEALSTVVKGYKMNLNDAAKAGEVMARATQIEGISFEQVARGLTKLSATAEAVGVSFSELIGAYLTLQERQDPQLAMMQLRMLLTNLMKPSNQAQKAARDLGIEWSASGVKAMGFVNWLKKLNQVTAGSADVLDNLVPGGRQMIGMLELVGNNAQETSKKVEALNKAWNEGGVVQEAFYQRLHSTSFLLDTAKEIFNRFKIAIFQGFSQPLLEGVANQKDFEKRLTDLTNKAVDFGTKVGKAIYDVVTLLVKLAGTLKMVLGVWLTFWAANKIAAWGNAAISAINVAQTGFIRLQFAGMAMVGIIQKMSIALAVFAAGWQIGRWISDVTGLTKASMKVGSWGVGKKDLDELNAMVKMKELTRGTDTNIQRLRKEYGSWAEAVKAVQGGLVTLVPHQKTASELAKEQADYQKALSSAMQGTLETTDKGIESLGTLTEEQKNHIIEVNKAREEMKKYGFTFKTELVERYNALSQGLKIFRKDMTTEDYEKLRKVLRDLGADLGYTSKSLQTLGLLTKDEVNEELKKQYKLLGDLTQAFKLGTISEDQYEQGIKKIDESMKRLDSTLTVTERGVTKLVSTPLPAARDVSGLLGNIPAVLSESEANFEEFSAVLKGSGLSMAYLNQLSSDLGVTLTDMASVDLPRLTAEFQFARSKGLIAVTNLGTAADTLIQHYKDAGEEIPKWLQEISDKAAKTAVATKDEMIKAFSTLGTALQVLGDSVGEKLKALVSVGASVAGELVKNLEAIFEKTGGKKLTFKNFKAAFKELSGELAGSLGAALGGLIGGGGANTYGGIGSALGGALGSIIPGVGNVIGSLVGGLFGGLFKKKKTAEQRAAEELARQVESVKKSYASLGKISDETAKKIVELTKQFNSQTAAIMTLTDVMNDAGISTKNLSGYISKMKQALSDIRNGSVEATKGVDAIASAFGTLMAWAQKFGQEGNKQLVSFMQYLRKLGVSIKEIDDYVYSQLGNAAAGLNSMTSALGGKAYIDLMTYKDEITKLTEEVQNLQKSRLDTREQQADFQQKKTQLALLQEQYDVMKNTLATDLAPELERISNLTVATFNSILAQGGSMTDAFAALKDPLTSLKEKYAELGITGNAAIQELLKMADVEATNAGLFEALDGNRQVLEALGNTGFLTADSLKDVAGQAQSFYDKLTGAGLTSQQALASIAPTLADMEYYSKQYGITLDDNTKKLIDQAKEAGVYKEKGKDLVTTLKEGFDGIIGRLDRLIDRIGGKGRGSLADSLEEAAQAGEVLAEAEGTGGREGRRGAPVTHAANGFYGTVTGPRMFYVEPGVTEQVKIGKPGEQGSSTTIVERPITIKPVLLPMKELGAFVIEFVQEASEDERILIRPRAVRGGA